MDKFRNLNIIVEGTKKDSISLSNPSSSQTSTLIAYRPNYNDYHNSGLGAVFFNIQKIFTCTSGIRDYEPVCSVFTREEEGFRKGNAFIAAADIGNNMDIFGGNSVVAVAIQNCSEFTTDCFSSYLQSEVVCMLPRDSCAP
jgi:hypothetical protein